MKRFSLLIPVHNEAENIAPLYAEITRVLAAHDCEVVVVNDGSTDATGAALAQCAGWTILTTPQGGKSRALELGLRAVTTPVTVMMDGDLQDDTNAVPAMVARIEAGADCVVGTRALRRDSLLGKRLPSWFFNLYLGLLFEFRFLDVNTGLKAFRTEALRGLTWFQHCHRFFPVLIHRRGGRVAHEPTVHRERHAGTAKFNSPLRFFGGFWQALLIRLGLLGGRALPGRVRAWRWLPLVTALGCTAFFFHWSQRDWLFHHYDAVSFLPHAKRYATDGELVNRFMPTARLWDPAGTGRMVGHGFLPAMLAGTVVPEPSFRALHFVYSGLAGLSLLLLVPLLRRFAIPVDRPRPVEAVLASLAIVFFAYVLNRYFGRPELFAAPLTLLSAWVFLSIGPRTQHIVAGLTMGLLAVTSPVAALAAGTVYVAYVGWSRTLRHAARGLAVAGVMAAVTMALAFAWYPYSLPDWLAGNLRHADKHVVMANESWRGRIFWAWMFDPAWAFRGLLAVLVSGATLTLLARRWRQSRLPWLTLAGIALLAAQIWYFALRKGFGVYNYDWMVAVGLVVPLAALAHAHRPVARIALALVSAALLSAAPLAMAHEHVLRTVALAHGPSAPEVRRTIDGLLARFPAGGVVSPILFHLVETDRDEITTFLEISKLPTLPDGARFLVMSQYDLRYERERYQPPAIPGWQLVDNHFTSEPLRAGGRILAATPRGYFHAVYLRPDAL